MCQIGLTQCARGSELSRPSIDSFPWMLDCQGQQLALHVCREASPVSTLVGQQRVHIGVEYPRIPPRRRDQVGNPRVVTQESGRSNVAWKPRKPPQRARKKTVCRGRLAQTSMLFVVNPDWGWGVTRSQPLFPIARRIEIFAIDRHRCPSCVPLRFRIDANSPYSRTSWGRSRRDLGAEPSRDLLCPSTRCFLLRPMRRRPSLRRPPLREGSRRAEQVLQAHSVGRAVAS